MEPFIKINGRPFPYPKRGLELLTSTFVDSARNTAGQVVGQKVGRDQYKINRCEWPVLDAEQWAMMLSMLNDFFVDVTFPDPVHNAWRTLRMYPGDRSAEPYFLDETTGLPTLYRNCKVNLIDAGYDDTTPLPVPPQYQLQVKTVVPSTVEQSVKPDSPAYYGLSEVIVRPSKPLPVLIDTTVFNLTTRGDIPNGYRYQIDPPAGYDGFKSCVIRTIMDNITVTPSESKQSIYPREGRMGLQSVTIDPIPSKYVDTDSGTAAARHILEGHTAFSKGQKIVGAMKNNRYLDGTIDGLETTEYNIPMGFTFGGKVTLASDIENRLRLI